LEWIIVLRNGVTLQRDYDFSISGTTITLSTPPRSTERLWVYYLIGVPACEELTEEGLYTARYFDGAGNVSGGAAV
jgi:hypothetical protein